MTEGHFIIAFVFLSILILMLMLLLVDVDVLVRLSCLLVAALLDILVYWFLVYWFTPLSTGLRSSMFVYLPLFHEYIHPNHFSHWLEN